ncbi:MAG: MFS transporter [Anaerolineae bacterium]|nr:MFS transporter [Anaerolineae bacterium]
MAVFTTVWLGQLFSIVGSGLTGFALGVWVFEQTGSATQYALIGLFNVLPKIVLSPLAGVIADKWDRRLAMIVSDAGAGISTLVLALLLYAGRLEIWHIYALTAISASFSTIQWPAFAAATTLLVPQKDLGRTNGMMQLGQAAAEILSPALAGVLLGVVRLEGVILIDFATFILAVATLGCVRFPQPQEMDNAPRVLLKQELAVGWKYIAARQGLLGLLFLSTAINFLWGMVGALITPMILGFTSSEALGAIISIAGTGMLIGGLVMSVWGGPKRRINGILAFEFLSGVCFMLIGLRPVFWLTAVGAFFAHITIAIVSGSNQAIWQCKVAPTVQGRVFATQQTIASAAAPLAYLLAGPLADRLFEPMLAPNGALAGSVGSIIGVGSGRGIGLLFIAMGLAKMTVTTIGYVHSRIRLVEDELPDAAIPSSHIQPA